MRLKKLTAFLVFSLLFLVSFNQGVFSSVWENQNSEVIQKLSLDKITVISENKLEITFNNDILIDRELDFFVRKWDNEEYFSNIDENWEIKKSWDLRQISIEWNKVYLLLENKFVNNEEYEIVIISVTDVNYNTIESWLDWAIKFIVPSSFLEDNLEDSSKLLEIREYRTSEMNNVFWEIKNEFYDLSEEEFSEKIENEKNRKLQEKLKEEEEKRLEELSKESIKEPLIEENIELNSALGELNNNLNSEDLAWNEVSSDLVEKPLTEVADDLPTTWPREYLILFLSILLVTLFYYFRKNKKA